LGDWPNAIPKSNRRDKRRIDFFIREGIKRTLNKKNSILGTSTFFLLKKRL